MYTVSVETRFRASHQLILSDGSREDTHEHDWRVITEVSSDKLDDAGVVVDFQQLKALVGGIVAKFDNKPLNAIDFFSRNPPSAENVAKYIYEKLEPQLPVGLGLEHVAVVEEPGCSAKFAKSDSELDRSRPIRSRPAGREPQSRIDK
jgi:6-pyruvoyltetrahydropterin/6-carboxytetrahydropterin synthase